MTGLFFTRVSGLVLLWRLNKRGLYVFLVLGLGAAVISGLFYSRGYCLDRGWAYRDSIGVGLVLLRV